MSSLSQKLKKRAAESCDRKGYCLLPDRAYARIQARRYHHTRDELVGDSVGYIIEDGIFYLIDGVTGFEAWYVEDILNFPTDEWWAACAGTPSRWNKLMVNGAEISAIVNEIPDFLRPKRPWSQD